MSNSTSQTQNEKTGLSLRTWIQYVFCKETVILKVKLNIYDNFD